MLLTYTLHTTAGFQLITSQLTDTNRPMEAPDLHYSFNIHFSIIPTYTPIYTTCYLSFIRSEYNVDCISHRFMRAVYFANQNLIDMTTVTLLFDE